MHTLTIKHKYHSGDIVYFMKDNRVRKGVVSQVRFNIQTKGFRDGYYVERLFKQLIANFNNERKYEVSLQYIIDMVWNDNGEDRYHSTPHYFNEDEIFFKKEDLTNSLIKNL